MLPKNRRPITPGEILREEYLEPLKITQEHLAKELGITRVRINEIILGKRSITPDTAYRLSCFFNTTPEFWLNMQRSIDLWNAFQRNAKDYEKIQSFQHV